MKFRPCIDLHDGKVKQIVGSSLSDNGNNPVENFTSAYDAGYYAKLFKKDGLKGGHVIMLGKGNEKQALLALETYPGGLQVGGGINPDNARQYLDCGASHVIVTTYLFEDKNFSIQRLEKLSSITGKKNLVLDFSCKKSGDKYFITADRWNTVTGQELTMEFLKKTSEFCDEFLIHAVDVEGKKQGIDESLVTKLGEWTGNPVTYAGGVKSMSDVELIRTKGKGRVDFTVGSALDLFGGHLSYEGLLGYK